MKIVTWTDKDGYNHRSMLRDSDPDDLAYAGIPLDPPSLDQLDWDEMKRNLHNALVDQGLHDMRDVNQMGNGITSAIMTTFKRQILVLYKMQEAAKRNAKSGG